MKTAEVRGLTIDEVADSELPHRVEIIGRRGVVHGAGATLAGALMRAFSVSGMFPDEKFTRRTEAELARFIFYWFHMTRNMRRAITVLKQAAATSEDSRDSGDGEGDGA